MPYSYISRTVSHSSLFNSSTVQFALATVLTAGKISLLASSVLITSPSIGSSELETLIMHQPIKLDGIETLLKAQQSSVNIKDFPNIVLTPISNQSLTTPENQTRVDREVLVKVEGAKCCIVAKGEGIKEYLSRINGYESEEKTILIHALDSEVRPLQYTGDEHPIKDFKELSELVSQYKEYQKFNRNFYDELNKNTRLLTQGLDGLSDIAYILDIAANAIEIGTAAGGISIWLIKKILTKQRQQKGNNYFVKEHINRVESVVDYFEKVPKSRIAEISAGTGISKEKLSPILTALSFEHEPACFWKPPTINKELLKPALHNAEIKREKKQKAIRKFIKYKSIILFVPKFLITLLVIWAMDLIMKSSLNLQLTSILVLFALLIILLVWSWQPNIDVSDIDDPSSKDDTSTKSSTELRNKKVKNKNSRNP